MGSDGIFHELKTFSGSAPATLPLTEHEYRRAGNKGDVYELVVAENVWDDPTITIVGDPLGQLRYSPTGGVVVQNWRRPKRKPRVLRLGKVAAKGTREKSGKSPA